MSAAPAEEEAPGSSSPACLDAALHPAEQVALSPPAAEVAPALRETNAEARAAFEPRSVAPDACAGGCWEVHREKHGWTPLAPALQPALDAAMASNKERVELLIDTSSKAWVPDADEAAMRRCAVYVALPRESKMGKVGGEPPRPIRWRPSTWTDAVDEVDAEAEAEDPLMFTAKPVDGIVINSSIFERLQQGVSERYAGHRYAENGAASGQLCVEGAY